MVAYAVDALAWCKAHLGMPYYAGGCRCEVTCSKQDCSGWCVAATRAAGLWIPCINSSGFAIWGREAGKIIPFEQAIWTPFALLIRGDNGGEDGDGPKGHIVPCVGDGLHTYEEMGTRWGACIGTVFGRRWDRAIEVPGLIYGPKGPIVLPQEEDVPNVIFAPTYMSPDPDAPAAVSLDISGKKIGLHNGARVNGVGQRVGSTIAIPADQPIISWNEIFNHGGTSVGFKILQKKGPNGKNQAFTYTWVLP